MITKEDFYYSPINNLSFIDNLIFYSKLVLFIVAFAFLITLSVLLGKIIPPIEKWLPVFFYKMAQTVYITQENTNNKNFDFSGF